MKKMMIGYISERNLEMNPHLTERFVFKEASFTRRISSRGDRIYTKLLYCPVDYEEIVNNAKLMKENNGLMIVREPFLLDDELRDRAIAWCDWANKANPEDYSIWGGMKMGASK